MGSRDPAAWEDGWSRDKNSEDKLYKILCVRLAGSASMGCMGFLFCEKDTGKHYHRELRVVMATDQSEGRWKRATA